MKILLTGFDPFGKDVVNPAWEAVNKTSNQIGNVDNYLKEILTH